jgi:DNA-binding beta-propeller fold protein YncE
MLVNTDMNPEPRTLNPDRANRYFADSAPESRRWFVLGCFAGLLATGLLAQTGDTTFAGKPKVTKAGNGVKIEFAVAAPTDVEVAVLGATNQVVRHLAAGVLGGANPPPEPLQPGLAQSLVWDGQDDFGKAVLGGPFQVRVRTGTSVRFGRFIAEDPYVFGGVDAMVTGEDGNLYVSGFLGPANMCQKTLRVFSPEGQYIRTLLPFPADLPPGAMKEVARWDEAAQTWRPRNLSVLNPEFYSSDNGYANYMLVAASQAGGLILVDKDHVYRLDLRGGVAGNSFATGQNPWPVFDPKNSENNHYGHPLYHQGGPTLFTASPDGKYLYLSGPTQNLKEKPKQLSDKFPPLGAIFRMKLDGKDEMQLFAQIPATADGPWSKDGARLYSASGPVHGVGVDLKGNVYVCDREKNRVVVFTEEGRQIGEVAVNNPDRVAVHPRTGAIYVIRRFCNGWGTHSMILDKFNNFEPGATVVASFTKFNINNAPQMVVTTSGEKTILWFAGTATTDVKLERGETGKGLLALEDKGTEFQVAPAQYGPKPGAQSDFARIATDPLREEVYVRFWFVSIVNARASLASPSRTPATRASDIGEISPTRQRMYPRISTPCY